MFAIEIVGFARIFFSCEECVNYDDCALWNWRGRVNMEMFPWCFGGEVRVGQGCFFHCAFAVVHIDGEEISCYEAGHVFLRLPK